MKSLAQCLLLLMLLACPTWGQSPSPAASATPAPPPVAESLERAQQALLKGNYGQASDLYQEILTQSPSDDYRLHYNLALAEQNLNHKGEARAHYEMAHQLNPWDSDVNHNLAHLRNTLDDVEPDPSLLPQLATLFSSTVLFIVLSLSHFCFWYNAWKYRQAGRELHLWATLSALLFTLACLGLVILRWRLPARAAVLPASVVLKNGPGREFTESMSLHAGTLVEVVRREGDWTEVDALGSVRAWIPESDLARVN